MLSKPCGRGGCTGTVYASGQRHLEKTKCCSHRCSYLERVRMGTWCTHTLTPEESRRGGAKAAKVIARKNHEDAINRACARAFRLLPRDIVNVLTRRQLAALRLTVGRIWTDGRDAGYALKSRHKKRAERAAKTEAA